MDNYYLIYASYSQKQWSEEDLTNLLRRARAYNGAKEITGMLLFFNNRFLQLLEGSKQNVLPLLEKIKNDERHDDLLVLI